MWQTFLLAIWVITCFWTQRNCYFSVKKSFRCESLQTNFLLFSGSYFLFCFKIWEHFVRSNERNIVEMILDKILFLPPQGKKRRWSRKVYFIIVKKYGMKKKRIKKLFEVIIFLGRKLNLIFFFFHTILFFIKSIRRLLPDVLCFYLRNI